MRRRRPLAAAPQIETAAPAVRRAACRGRRRRGEPDPRQTGRSCRACKARSPACFPPSKRPSRSSRRGPTHPREMERAARALAALTRTLRELNGLLSQRQAAAADGVAADDDMPEDIDAFRLRVWRDGSSSLSRPAPARPMACLPQARRPRLRPLRLRERAVPTSQHIRMGEGFLIFREKNPSPNSLR